MLLYIYVYGDGYVGVKNNGRKKSVIITKMLRMIFIYSLEIFYKEKKQN